MLFFVQALSLFRRDVLALENGADLWYVNQGSILDLKVFGALGMTVADLPQGLKNKGQIGVNANYNDGSSWKPKDDRIRTDLDLWDHTVTRRKDQNQVVKRMIEEELSTMYFESAEKSRSAVVVAALAGDEQKAPVQIFRGAGLPLEDSPGQIWIINQTFPI